MARYMQETAEHPDWRDPSYDGMNDAMKTAQQYMALRRRPTAATLRGCGRRSNRTKTRST